MAAPIDSASPAADEVEVSIFGPGRGESVLVHIGNGNWIAVDSCVDDRTGSHPALEYLDSLGVDVAARLRLVVATHAHDDHTAGISTMFERAQSAKFVTSTAFTSSEFFASMEADASIEDQLVPSVRSEYRKVIHEAQRRPRSSKPHILQASESKLLFTAEAWPSGPNLRVVAMSPSDEAITRSKLSVARGAAREGDRVRLAAADPNEYTVALWFEFENQLALLLGGDLLNGPTACGWKRVVDSHSSSLKASLIKVPHHGSEGSHYQPAWDMLLQEDVVSVLTPFRMGESTSIPKTRDIERILASSGRAFITAKPHQPAPSRALKQTRALFPPIAANVRERDGLPGHVQARIRPTEADWRIRTSAPAYQLS